jgi:hydrogenase maturation protease
LVDASPRGEPPGTLFVIEPEPAAAGELAAGPPQVDLHTLDPVKVLQLVKAMGGKATRVLLVGCEPETLDADHSWDDTAGLSEPVRRAVDRAVVLIESIIKVNHEDSQHQLSIGRKRETPGMPLASPLQAKI